MTTAAETQMQNATANTLQSIFNLIGGIITWALYNPIIALILIIGIITIIAIIIFMKWFDEKTRGFEDIWR
jgi:uncharacterized membrane protein YcaP (DUF421 family)